VHVVADTAADDGADTDALAHAGAACAVGRARGCGRTVHGIPDPADTRGFRGRDGNELPARLHRRMQGPECSLPHGPVVSILNQRSKVLVRTTDILDPQPITLHNISGYVIGWAADCDFSASGDLVARVEFSKNTIVDMPIGDFRPSCVDGLPNYNSVFMYDDDPDP
jgi:hypothetical protein